MVRRPERISSLNIERGVYVLRYISAAATDHPVIFIRSSPGYEDDVTLIAYPGEAVGRLDYPGSLAVIVASQASTLQLTAQAASPNGSLNAEVRLEPLVPGRVSENAHTGSGDQSGHAGGSMNKPADAVVPVSASVVQAQSLVARPSSESEIGVDILAHVSRRGDVVSRNGDWIAGPDAPAPLEGLAVTCPASLGAIQYQVLVSGENRWSEWLSDGAFGGSRGRAKPLTGVKVRLVPAAEGGALLNGEALFLGSAIIRKEGLDLEFRSAAGLDPLVGLRIGVAARIQAGAPKPGIVSTTPQNGRVRVFKASGRRSG